MHVMHVVSNFGPGGAEMGVVRLVRSSKNDVVRHSVCSFGPDLSMADLLGKKDQCHTLSITGASRGALIPLYRLLKKEHVDIVHVNNLGPWTDTVIAANLAGCRCIATFHGIETSSLKFGPGKRLQYRVSAFLTWELTTVSLSAAKLLSGLAGIPMERIRVIQNGINAAQFKPVESDEEKRIIREGLGIFSDGIVVSCIAALRPVKNHRGLLDAMKDMLSNIDMTVRLKESLLLMIIGDGELESALKDLCRDYAIEDNVRFLGRRNDVVPILQASDIFVLNSETEGLSYALLEAMACGLPVVATEVGGNPELIESGKEGLLVPFGDNNALSQSLLKLIQNKNERTKMGTAARKKVVSRFSFDAMLSAYQELYRQQS